MPIHENVNFSFGRDSQRPDHVLTGGQRRFLFSVENRQNSTTKKEDPMLTGTVKVRYLLTLFIMTLLVSPVYAFDCPWTALDGLKDNMVVFGSLYVDGQKVTSGYCIGAFGPGGSGDCRAVGDSASIYYLTVGGNTNGDTITFQIFENATGHIFDVSETVTFLADDPSYEGDFNLHASTSSPSCSYTLAPTSSQFSNASNTGTVEVTTSSDDCSWSAESDVPWITITQGSEGTGSGTVSYSVSANTTGSNRTGTMTIAERLFTVTQSGESANHLYFPHVDTSIPWQTEIAIVNTGNQTVTGTLRALSNEGQLVDTKAVTLSARGRRQITVANEFTNHTDIGYMIFDTSSDAVQGYTKHSMAGNYRTATPAVKEVNTSDIYISHIASNADWWTGVSLVNTTSASKQLTITFNNGQHKSYTLNANGHAVFDIADLFNNQPPADIQSAVITNASGVIGLELFGSLGWATQLEGILLTDKTTSTIYYPHVDNNGWWTGIVAYNPSASACTITITPYDAQGTPLSPMTPPPIAGKGKYVGAVDGLGLPAQTAWFKIDSTRPITGFELFGTVDGKQLAAYAEKSGAGAKAGIFAKIEKNGGWTGIAFVNTEETAASVTLTAYNDAGAVVASQALTVGGHAKVVSVAEALFSQNISSATYVAYSSDKNVVGFQLNGSSNGLMLDSLPGM
jgi:hypothetical protein